MRGLVVSEPGAWAVTDWPRPKPGPGEILVAPKAVGICGSDLHILAGEFPPTPYPIIPGHEFAGVVAEAGAGTGRVSVGQRVAVDPSLFCGACRYCQAGRRNLCANWGAIGDTVPGAFAEYVTVPETNAYVMPDAMSFTAAALAEPISCVIHGLDRLSIRVGADVLIIGGGAIGSLLLQAARHAGAVCVDVVDTDESRLERATRFGADNVATSVGEAVSLREHGYEYVIEATGVPAAVQDSLIALDRGGTLLVFGVAPADGRVDLRPFRVYNDEQSIIGSMAILNSFTPAMRLLTAGVIDPEAIVTHTFPLEEFDAALGAMRKGEGLKVQIVFD